MSRLPYLSIHFNSTSCGHRISLDYTIFLLHADSSISSGCQVETSDYNMTVCLVPQRCAFLCHGWEPLSWTRCTTVLHQWWPIHSGYMVQADSYVYIRGLPSAWQSRCTSYHVPSYFAIICCHFRAMESVLYTPCLSMGIAPRVPDSAVISVFMQTIQWNSAFVQINFWTKLLHKLMQCLLLSNWVYINLIINNEHDYCLRRPRIHVTCAMQYLDWIY